jgi:hypothetical protein
MVEVAALDQGDCLGQGADVAGTYTGGYFVEFDHRRTLI